MLQNITLYIACSLVTFCACAQTKNNAPAGKLILNRIAFAGIQGKVFNSKTGTGLPARIVVTDDSGNVVNPYYKFFPGFFTETDGTFQQLLQPGNYTLAVFHGIDYTCRKIPFTINDSGGLYAQLSLQPWSPLKKNGWVCGDGHDHLYTEKKQDTTMISMVKKICLAQGIDFVFAAQGWAGYNDSNWREGYARFNDDGFTISYGSEMPKYRTGHTWWMGQTSTRNYFWNAMDTAYENLYYQSPQGTTWDFHHLPFPFIPDVELVQRLKALDNSIAVTAHPTSWWWQKRGEIEKHVTNVAANLSFGLLSGKIWDAVVVMGYNHDHYFYQNLWFHILNEGYRMPAISELDGGFEKDDKKYYGSLRTYYHINGPFSVKKVNDAVRKGRTFVTSGPIVITDVDNKYQVGDIIRTNGKENKLHIKAYASGDKDDYLSYIVVYRNGKIYRLWDTRVKRPREFNTTLLINEKSKGWYIIKVYGKNAWINREHLDLMTICENGPEKNFITPAEQVDVAITSPYYFWPAGEDDPPILLSNVDLSLTPANQIAELKNVTVDILLNGKKVNTVILKNGQGKFTMPVNGILKISAEGYTPLYRSLYLDYPPHQQLLEELATGNWLKKYDSTRKYVPGEVPWEEFHFTKTREVLSNIRWNITMLPNEREALWESFQAIFSKPVSPE